MIVLKKIYYSIALVLSTALTVAGMFVFMLELPEAVEYAMCFLSMTPGMYVIALSILKLREG